MKTIYFLFFVFFLSAISACSKISNFDCMCREDYPVNAFITADKASEIANEVCGCINSEKVPAIQISIIDSVGRIWTLSSGSSDLKRKNLINDESIFRLASITKTFTATVILKLIEDGQLSFDTKLTDYFPEFVNAQNVTIKNLLNHSSGIKELLMLPYILTNSTLFTDKIWDVNDIIKTISKKKTVFETDTDHQYSNTNFVLLGLIAEKVTGKKMAVLYDEIIFSPLAITNIKLLPQQQKPDFLISGYDRKLLPTPGIYEITPDNTAWSSNAFTSGALVGNTKSTSIFYHNLLLGRIIKNASLNAMKSFEQPVLNESEFLNQFGLGLFKYEINGNTYFGHEGLFIGFDNITCFREIDKTTIVILGNISSFEKFQLLKKIDKIIAL